MRPLVRCLMLAVTALACGCAEAQTQQGGPGEAVEALRAASCPHEVEPAQPEAIALGVAHVPLQGLNLMRRTIGELTFVGGFHLTSPDRRFGGLSGLDMLDDGRLLAVTDAGDFVWLTLDADAATPIAASLAGMRDANGLPLGEKAQADAEGLAVMDGVALVSFEGDHRVLAFDIERCGANARGAPVTSAEQWTAAFARQSLQVGGNSGVEALAIAPGGFMLAGLETMSGEASLLSARAIEAAPEFDLRIGEGAPSLVGLDVVPGQDEGFTAYSLHRSTTPLVSEVIVLLETTFSRKYDQTDLPARVVSEVDERARMRFRSVASRKLAAMNVLVTIDNFEGIAAHRMPGGGIRLYLVSDDNFSASQRTLLMVFDIATLG